MDQIIIKKCLVPVAVSSPIFLIMAYNWEAFLNCHRTDRKFTEISQINEARLRDFTRANVCVWG
jgi:hypothetical protein